MKMKLAMSVLILALFGLQAMAKDKPVKLTGTPEDITKQITADFPSGLPRDALIEKLKTKYALPVEKINLTEVKQKPIEVDREGKKVEIHSWVNATLCEYRSFASLFSKNYVSVEFNFDAERNLVFFKVSVAKGPEL